MYNNHTVARRVVENSIRKSMLSLHFLPPPLSLTQMKGALAPSRRQLCTLVFCVSPSPPPPPSLKRASAFPGGIKKVWLPRVGMSCRAAFLSLSCLTPPRLPQHSCALLRSGAAAEDTKKTNIFF